MRVLSIEKGCFVPKFRHCKKFSPTKKPPIFGWFFADMNPEDVISINEIGLAREL